MLAAYKTGLTWLSLAENFSQLLPSTENRLRDISNEHLKPFLESRKTEETALLGLVLQGSPPSILFLSLCVHGWKCVGLWKWPCPMKISGSQHLLEPINYLRVFRLNVPLPRNNKKNSTPLLNCHFVLLTWNFHPVRITHVTHSFKRLKSLLL